MRLNSLRLSCGSKAGILILMAVLLSGCGFSLRGSDAITGNLPALRLNLQQPNSETARLLRRALNEAGVDLVNADVAAGDIPVLSIGAEQVTVQPVTVTPRARAAQYDIRIALPVTLTRGQNALLGPEDLVVQQLYFEDTENITGNQEEVAVIQSEMRRELVSRLLRRLESI